METKNWWDGWTEAEIDGLKRIQKPLCFSFLIDQDKLKKIPHEHLEFLDGDGKWKTCLPHSRFWSGMVYRLNPNWQKPEPKKTDLEKEADRVLFKIIVDEMTRDDDDNIKPCPHCGKPPNEFSVPLYPGTAYQGSAPFQIRCSCTKAESMYGARVRWNQRKETK